MSYEIRFLQALALTVAAEGVVIIALMRLLPGVRRYGSSLTKTIVAGTLPSVATLPYLWFVVPALINTYAAQLIIGEVAVFAVETLIIRFLVNLPLRWCALLSLSANGASILAGLAVFR